LPKFVIFFILKRLKNYGNILFFWYFPTYK
jgi:hypothetical protein